MMFNDHIHAALARERSGTLLAGAEAARRGRQARAAGLRRGRPRVTRSSCATAQAC